MTSIPQRIAALSPEQRKMLARYLAGAKKKEDGQPRILPSPREGNRIPLSFTQQRIWFFEQLVPDSPTYNVTQVARVVAPMSVAILKRCFQEIIARHETLHTTFTVRDGQPVGIVNEAEQFTFAYHDLRTGTMEQRELRARQLVAQNARQPFDLEHGPLLRVTLLQLADQEHLIVLTMHHIISDGWSARVLFQEIGSLYWAFASGNPSPLPPLPFQYADFARWQQEWLQHERLNSLLAYWKQQVAGAPLLLELPTDHPRPALQSFQGSRRAFVLPAEMVQALKDLARSHGATLVMVLLAAFKTLLYRYSRQEVLLVGLPIANRNQPGTEALIGAFLNTLVIRTDLSGDPTFVDVLNQVRRVTLDAYAHQDLPFEKLVEELQPERNLSYSPLFQVLFNFKRDAIEMARIPVLKLEDIDNGTTQFDLALNLIEGNTSISGYIEYSTDLFEASTIERMVAHFQVLLKGIIANPRQRIAQLPLLTEHEQQMLRTWNATQEPYAASACIHELVAAQAIQRPQQVAISFDDQELTYQELNQRANQLARYLQSAGAGPETLVGICMERSLEMMVGLLGILKAGCAYVPLDPSFPQERLAFMQQDAHIALLLTQQRLLKRVPVHTSRVVCLDTDWEYIDWESAEEVTSAVTATNAAYILYTSGSTGVPKGVVVQHRSVVNILQFMARELGITADDSWLAVTTLSFDIATLELFLPLVTAARLMIARGDVVADGLQLAKLVSRATIMQATPATWRMLLAAGWQGHERLKILCGGEALPRKLANQLLRCGEALWNVYGPTETTIWSTIERVTDGDGPVSIGRPIANTQIYLLDHHLQPTPIGVAGELYIGGDGLARGYYQREALTAEKFICSPFSRDKDARLYKTGDLARFLPDGRIEFIGRVDHQIKLRGFRIELGEIEAHLRTHPAVQEAVALVREESGDEKRLVAYLVSKEQPTAAADLRLFLQSKLPDYMIPGAFVWLDAFPLTPNGKIDRKALPMPSRTQNETGQRFVAPSTDMEKIVAPLWEQVLGISPIGIHDSFFDLGGHSLLATKLVFQMRTALQVEIPLHAFFQSPTIAGMAHLVEVIKEKGVEALAALAPSLDLSAEAVLDPAIQPQAGLRVRSVVGAKKLFITGATGFIGAFLLDELLHQTEADLFCLVRASDSDTGKQRIQSSMQEYGLWDERFSHRIIAIPGDLARPYLGLDQQEYERLADSIDVIYHNGASVNFMYPYASLKPVNVLGTQEVLRLACSFSIKPVHHISTIYAFSRAEYQPGDVLLEQEQPRHGLKYTLGYTQSKWVAEQLIMEAGKRGLPVSIYRLGRVAGHSQNGVSQVNDFVWQAIRVGIRVEAAPDIDMLLDMAPVDYVIQALVHISRQPEAVGKHFHLINERRIHSKTLIAWMDAFGYKAQLVPFDQWCARVRERAEQLDDNTAGVLAPILSGVLPIDQLPEVIFATQNTEEFLRGTAISCPPIDDRLLTTYFTHFVQNGYFDPPKGVQEGSRNDGNA